MHVLPLETLMRAAEGGEREADLVRADFRQVGAEGWLRAAMERRLDPALVARVVPAGTSGAVCVALEAFYALWGRWFPLEYRRVRREWVVLRARWRADAPAESPPAVDPVTSRLFSERLADAGPVAMSSGAGEREAGIETPDAAGSDGGAAGREPMSPEGEPPANGDGVRSAREPGAGGSAPVAAGPVPGRLPDGTEVLADHGGGLALSAAADRLDQAVLGGVAAVEAVRADWVGGTGGWRRWPACGRWQERSR